jgi:cell division protein FtsN
VTRDYKNLPKSSDKKKSKSTPKKAGNGSRKKQKKPTPGWVWMLGGLAIGLLVALVVYFADRGNETVKQAKQAVDKAIKAVPKPEAKKSDKEESRFDFYTLLPELEVIIPESEIKKGRERIKEKETAVYMLQVGSFRSYTEADSLKAQLALLGVEASIDPVSSKGEQWLRVRVGPFTDTRALNQVRNRLNKNNINTMLVQIKK